MSDRLGKLSHTIYECKYRIAMCPKVSISEVQGEVAEYAKQQLHSLCRQKDMVEVLESNILEDPIHLAASIPPKYSVFGLMG